MEVLNSQSVKLSGKLPTMNEIIRGAKSHWSVYAKQKAQWTKYVEVLTLPKLVPVRCPVVIKFNWTVGDKKTDPDNISAGGRKCILDGLVGAGILQDDSFRWIRGFSDVFEYLPGKWGVQITLIEVE